MSGEQKIEIKLQPGERIVWIEPGRPLREAFALAGWRLETPCGGLGTCGKCRVRISPRLEVTANEREILSAAEIMDGMRLACQVLVNQPLEVSLPVVTREVCRKIDVMDERIGELSVAGQGQGYGVALDLGTTTIAGSLVELHTGRRMALAAELNPQVIHGADVLSRLAFAMQGEAERRQLQREAVAAANVIIGRLIKMVGLDISAIKEGVVVGNTVMHHLMLGLDPVSLSQAPYRPLVSHSVWACAEELGFNLTPGTNLHFLPNIGGFVGGDAVAVLLATGLVDSAQVKLILDIGTNGEIMLGSTAGLWVCSTAAGPAFEGGRITHGMRAATGAIEKVRIIDDEVEIAVIGEGPACGICGSGLIQAVAELYRVGLVDKTGRLLEVDEVPAEIGVRSRLTVSEGEREFILVPAEMSAHGRAISITQQDIRELQLGKGAIRAGVETLLKELQTSEPEIAEVILTGTFGTYLDIPSTVRIGLIPPRFADRVTLVGNAALLGAEIALVSSEARVIADQIARKAKRIELANRADFTEFFINYLNFGV
ncbi:MAG: DUF4445 domain-containing protein [Firmicutes bacterium]|nr:DUF4445 domain-containing protein [Bacillota bacterium]